MYESRPNQCKASHREPGDLASAMTTGSREEWYLSMANVPMPNEASDPSKELRSLFPGKVTLLPRQSNSAAGTRDYHFVRFPVTAFPFYLLDPVEKAAVMIASRE